ncbi:quinone oxidoreductase family protein [Silvibacterium sp.]|uniref:quinone oxidoreductase family protein n=1 Tax=Silvibacterium sp. TaxID=1964179 RepID=UPI0039E5A97D
MRAIEFRSFGEPNQLEVVERPDCQATESTAIVRIVAASINPSDVKNVAGRMEQTTLPRVPGRDYSGVVVDGPEEWIGVEVWGTGGDAGFTRDGTHAEFISVPRSSLVRKPECLTHEQAASIGVTFVTAWCAVKEYAKVQPGEIVAIIGSRGGVGSAAKQIAKYLGAYVIGVNRLNGVLTREEIDGEDQILDSANPEVASLLRILQGGRGADVVLNTAGPTMFEKALHMLARRGRLVEISAGAERRVSFDLADFYHNESQLLGVDSLKRDLVDAACILRELSAAFESGDLRPHSDIRSFPHVKVWEGYEHVRQGCAGRAVLTMEHV